ncbi:MAG: DUF4234 domain-containing protein [Candidatus Micrarchaeia archaeon]
MGEPIDPMRVIAFIISTFGLYAIFWYYKINKEISEYASLDINPLLRTLVFIIPILNLFVVWKTLNEIDHLSIDSGFNGLDTRALLVIFAIPPLTLYTIYAMQSALNEIWTAKG